VLINHMYTLALDFVGMGMGGRCETKKNEEIPYCNAEMISIKFNLQCSKRCSVNFD